MKMIILFLLAALPSLIYHNSAAAMKIIEGLPVPLHFKQVRPGHIPSLENLDYILPPIVISDLREFYCHFGEIDNCQLLLFISIDQRTAPSHSWVFNGQDLWVECYVRVRYETLERQSSGEVQMVERHAGSTVWKEWPFKRMDEQIFIQARVPLRGWSLVTHYDGADCFLRDRKY